jgi:hypothetical protein
MLQRAVIWIALLACLSPLAFAKPKSITFGRWLTVKWLVGPREEQPVEIKVRALLVNSEVKEFTMGDPHEVTDRVFVVRRAFRINDSLPADEDPKPKPQWSWRPGGWLMVQRGSASISKLNLPEFDAYSSDAVWFRDYAAYCGISDDGSQVHAMVVQIGRRKPVLKKLLGPAKMAELPNSECESPEWQKNPARVTFQIKGGQKVSYEIRSFAVEIAPEEVED